MVQITRLKSLQEKSGNKVNVNTLTPKDPYALTSTTPFQAREKDFQDEDFVRSSKTFNEDMALRSERKFDDLRATPASQFSQFDNFAIDNWMGKYAFSNFVEPETKISNLTVREIAFQDAASNSADKMGSVEGITPSQGVSI